jgi:hypothetical protein
MPALTIQYPISFWFMVFIWVLSAALAFAFTLSHLVGIAGDVGLIAALRWLAFQEGFRAGKATA